MHKHWWADNFRIACDPSTIALRYSSGPDSDRNTHVENAQPKSDLQERCNRRRHLKP